MNEYGHGLTIGETGEHDKERIKRALKGEVAVDVDADGEFVFAEATREECERYILGVLDKWVYECQELAASGRAIERVMREEGFKIPWRRYFDLHTEESRRYRDYLSESELDEFAEEIGEIECGGERRDGE